MVRVCRSRQVTFESAHANQFAERCERRTNLFVSATLSWMQSFAPATIRNLSPSGALIEAPVLPTPGVSVQLSRGSLRIQGVLIWRDGRRGGLKFSGRIVVADWLPSGSALAQARVDQVVHAVKTRNPNIGSEADASETATSRSYADQIAELQVLLGVAADGLADDSLVVAEHGEKLQILDMVRQRLVQLSADIDRPTGY